MKEIPLTQGKIALVDDADYEWLMQWKWYAHKSNISCYAARRDYANNGKLLFMHRVLMNTPPGMDTDHRDANGLNNQRSNLRVVTRSQNIQNKRAKRSGVSQFRGVSWHHMAQKWQVHIRPVGQKTKNLGLFTSELDAARAYDAAARKHFGEFARLNFPA